MVAAGSRLSIEEEAIELWKKISEDCEEKDLKHNFISPLLKLLGLESDRIISNPTLGENTELKPDYLIYNDIDRPAVLVIKNKQRVSELGSVSDEDFINKCKSHQLYQEAVGYPEREDSHGIKQYLDKSNPNIDSNNLANYGLVLNGDFFQLWRRVDGLIFPLTDIQRLNESTIPELIQQLKYCIFEKQKALVTGIWNRKGGVSKTTNTLNLASVLALNNKKVLLIDFDTQADLTRALNLKPQDYEGYLVDCITKIQANKLNEAKIILELTIQSQKYSTLIKNEENKLEDFSLDILPGNTADLELLRTGLSTKKTEDELKGQLVLSTGEKIKCLKKIIEIISKDYDYILIDNSPSSDIVTSAILGSCDTVLIPCDYSRNTIHHAADLDVRILPKIKEFNSKKDRMSYKPLSMGIVFSNCPGNFNPKSHLEECIQKELESNGFEGKQFKTRLKSSPHTKLSEYKHKPVVCWNKSPIAKLYHQLTDEVFLSHNFIHEQLIIDNCESNV